MLHTVLSRLATANVSINLKKCEWAKAKITYLGFQIGEGKLEPKDKNTEAIRNFPLPTSRRELRRFLGMTGFYRRFFPNYSVYAACLTDLLSPKQKFQLSTEHVHAISNLKAMLINKPVLKVPDFAKPFSIYSDASGRGMGACLSQKDEQGNEHPVVFYSHKFNKAQSNYSAIEKEALALVLAVQEFHIYITNGFPVEIYVDQNPLVFINKMKNQNQRILRWSLLLQPYPLVIKHISGKNNVVADALSRL